MSRTISVYSIRQDVIPMDEIVSGMAMRRISVRWLPDALEAALPSSSGSAWDLGDLLIEDGPGKGTKIRLSQDFTEDEVRRDIAEALHDQMNEEQRRAVLGDGVEYRVSVGLSILTDRPRAVANLVDLLAERGGGPILDHEENRVYDRETYRDESGVTYRPD